MPKMWDDDQLLTKWGSVYIVLFCYLPGFLMLGGFFYFVILCLQAAFFGSDNFHRDFP